MANVHIQQPTNMTTLSTSFDDYLRFDLPQSFQLINTNTFFYMSILGSFTYEEEDVSSTNVHTAAFDNQDIDLITNILIENITVGAVFDVANALNSLDSYSVVQALLAGDDTITGSNGIDYILCWAGNDTVHAGLWGDAIDGNVGNDTLFGDAGNDVLGGSNDRDVLIGGAGADHLHPFTFANPNANDSARDTLRFLSLSDSGTTAATQDRIFGFMKGAGATADRIDLSPIDANLTLAGNQAFHLVSAFTAAKGEVRLTTVGGDTISRSTATMTLRST